MLEWRLQCHGWKSVAEKSEGITGRIRSVVQNELEKLITLCGEFECSIGIEIRKLELNRRPKRLNCC